MVEVADERELKFDVPDGFELPPTADLAKAAGRRATVATSTVNLASTYYDTPDRALLRHRVTLRRREGDTDTGWHLKVPHAEARTEIRLPLDTGTQVPAHLRDLVAGMTLGEPLEPIASVQTVRRLTRLSGGDALIAEIADDTVTGTTFGTPDQRSGWRELEIELGSGDEKVLARLAKAVQAAGARPSASASKLARTVGAETPVDPARDEATQMLAEYLAEQAQAVSAGDLGLRRGLDAVHKTRVAVRRLRSVLRVFAAVLPGADLGALETELSWWQNLLGEVRDREVQRARLAAAVAALPVDIVLGPVASDIDSTLLGEQLRARAELDAAMTTPRYFALLRRIRELADDPPTAPNTAIADLVTAADAAYKKAVARRKRGARTGEADTLHRARKAAKRARYAAELVSAADPKPMTKRVERLTALQDVLGEHQDSVQSARVLRRIGTSTGALGGHNGFTFGLLYQREQDRQAELLADAGRLHI